MLRYDALNRITEAIDNTGNYNVSGIAYDQNGNITALERKGALTQDPSSPTDFGAIDQLSYTYDTGNRLLGVSDQVMGVTPEVEFKDGNTGTDYDYDTNGNMTQDLNKGIPTDGITYNHLNLPTSVTIGGGNISYIYDATGVKLKKTVSTGKITEYAGNYIYENNQLQFFSHAEGYVTPNGSDYDYVYQYKDHLGNVRLSYMDADNNGSVTTDEVIEESNYYPFGLEHMGYGPSISSLGNDVAQRWKYNGIELEESLGLNLYEMELRQYDPTIARWTGIDPVTHHSSSTYNAFDNNPVFWADPSGADGEHYNWDTGRYEDDKGNEVSFEEAIGSYDLNFNETENTPPTKFVTEEGEVIVETADESDEIYVISKNNEDKFIANLAHNIDLKRDKDKSENDILGYRYGYNLKDHADNVDIGLDIDNYGDYGSDFSNEREVYFRIGYNNGYSREQRVLTELTQYFENSSSVGMGKGRGLSHKQAGRMHAYDPQISDKYSRYIIENGSIVKNNNN